jgi:hypothetical protein
MPAMPAIAITAERAALIASWHVLPRYSGSVASFDAASTGAGPTRTP